MTQRKSPRQGNVKSRQDLQERWKQLELKPATLLHVQEVLDRRGIMPATAVTEVLIREKQRKTTMAVVGREWSMEELRLMLLEGIRPRLLALVRCVLEAGLTWRFIHLPATLFDGMGEILLTLLFGSVGIGLVCLTCRVRAKRHAAR